MPEGAGHRAYQAEPKICRRTHNSSRHCSGSQRSRSGRSPTDPLLAQEFSTTYSSGSMSSPVTARAGQCSASIATHRAPRRDPRASWLCSRKSGMASRSSSDSRASLVSSGAAWTSSRLASGYHVAANAPVSPEVRSSGVTDPHPLDPCQRRNSQSTPSEAWVVTLRRIHVVPACRVMHNVRVPGGAVQTSEMTRPAIPTTMRTTPPWTG